jgi:Ni/Co efflux regulator RcnB
MMKSKNLAAVLAIATTAVMMTATSAFAESRHRGETRSDRNSSAQTDRNRGNDRVQRSGRSQAQTSRSQAYRDQSTYTQRFDNRSNGVRQQSNSTYRNDSYRNNSYGAGAIRNDGYRGGRQTFEGHVTRISPYNGGYRVWLDRGGYPFFIPAARFRLFPLRLGLNIRFGGIWDPLGYYNVYDVGPYGAYGGGYATSGDLRGVVESVDYRRGTLVLRDDISSSFVTTVLRGNDPRLGDLRPGDYVDLSGAWNRSGVFDAFNVVDIRGGAGYDNRYDNRDGRY